MGPMSDMILCEEGLLFKTKMEDSAYWGLLHSGNLVIRKLL